MSRSCLRPAIVLSTTDTVTEAMRAMQREHRGCVVVTDDGTTGSKVTGIFTERDVLFRIVDRGRNPATMPLADVMTPGPECLRDDEPVALVLNKMSVGGFRHVPFGLVHHGSWARRRLDRRLEVDLRRRIGIHGSPFETRGHLQAFLREV